MQKYGVTIYLKTSKCTWPMVWVPYVYLIYYVMSPHIVFPFVCLLSAMSVPTHVTYIVNYFSIARQLYLVYRYIPLGSMPIHLLYLCGWIKGYNMYSSITAIILCQGGSNRTVVG